MAGDTFVHILVEDVIAAQKRLASIKSDSIRRELIRTVFSGIEGLNWKLKQDVFEHADSIAKLSIHEMAALREETYSLDDRGIVKTQPRFFPLPSAIRMVINIVKRYRPGYEVDFNHVAWSNLKVSIEVRNRLVHPKDKSDLAVSDEEVKKCLSAFMWLLALVVEVLQETNIHMKELNETLQLEKAIG